MHGTEFPAPLVDALLDDALAHRCQVYGIAGLQGSGKSTLATQLVRRAARRGLRAVALSLDDVYLGRLGRAALARSVHPLFSTRGPPGTHDLPLALATLDALRAGRPTTLPRFDKLTDRRLPPSRWRRIGPVDLTIFEGWCLGVPAEPPEALVAPVNALERDEDPDGRWRTACNAALAHDYPALWARIDRLLFLRPPGFDCVPGWRLEQERVLQAARRPGAGTAAGLTAAGVDRFVQHFERISRQALRTLPDIAARTLTLDARRRVVADDRHASSE